MVKRHRPGFCYIAPKLFDTLHLLLLQVTTLEHLPSQLLDLADSTFSPGFCYIA